MRITQHQSNPSMGNKPTSPRILVELFFDRYHSLLLLAFMPFKAYKALLVEPLLYPMGSITNA
jgi:hypothetical protein